MKKTITLLLTSVGRRIELVQQFREAAQLLGIKLIILGADISSSAPALVFCDRTVIVPRIKDPDYIPCLCRICAAHQVDALIPTIDTDLLLLAENKALFEALGTTVFISRPEKIAICRDKRRTSDYFLSLGLSAPKAVSRIEDYDGGFPAFIKPSDGSSSIGANRADSWEELRTHAANLDDYVIQPFASGTEYTVDILCDTAGNPIYITPRIRLAVRAGEVLKTQIRHVPQIVEEMLVLIRDFKPCGAITVQLIRSEDTGTNHYIEINPRFGGGAPLSMEAGADSAAAILRLVSGETLSYVPNAAAEGAIYSRFDRCVCTHRGENPALSAVIFDLDDTLYGEKEYIRSGYAKVAAALPQIPDAARKLWAAFEAGLPAIDTVLTDAGICTDELKAQCLAIYRNQTPDIHLYDGVRQMLVQLRQMGIKTGIITDGRPEGQRAKLTALGLYDLVDTVVITDELGGIAFRKPNDIAFRIVKTRLNVPFRAMVYVGDNASKDFHAPRALGMGCIHFQNPDGLYTGSPCVDDTVSSIHELTARLGIRSRV